MVATWEMICATMLPVLNNGGTAGLFWGFLLIAGGYVMVYASLAEMASMVRPPALSRRDAILQTNTSLGRDLRRTVRLGQRVCSAVHAKVPQLHDGMAYLDRLAICNHRRLYGDCDGYPRPRCPTQPRL